MLPPRIPKKSKRASRWRSQAHAAFVRSHACCACGATAPIEFAHVRLGSHAGIGQRPDDWNAVSLCADCHRRQHNIGEASFWRGQNVGDLIAAFIKASPRRHQIEQEMRERGI
jgi:5-methylcytosine-specific restriction endonuclease McrA